MQEQESMWLLRCIRRWVIASFVLLALVTYLLVLQLMAQVSSSLVTSLVWWPISIGLFVLLPWGVFVGVTKLFERWPRRSGSSASDREPSV